MPVITNVLVEVDARGRANLAKAGAAREAYYLASQAEDGTIILTPATVTPASTVILA